MAKKGRKTKSETPRVKTIHINVTEAKKKKLMDLAKNSNTTISEFIRQAIDDKLRRIENPETYTSGANLNAEAFFEKILEKQKLLEQKNNVILKRLDTYSQIVNTLSILKPKVNGIYLKDKMEKVKNTLKAYEELKPKKLEELSGIDGNTIKDILAYYNKNFSITMKGGIKLNE